MRDPVRSLVRGEDGKRTEKEVDPGVSDKRALIIETEFARALEQSIKGGEPLESITPKVKSLIGIIRRIDGYDESKEVAVAEVGIST